MIRPRIGQRVVANRDIDGFFEVSAQQGTLGTVRRRWLPNWIEVEFDNGYVTELPSRWVSKAIEEAVPASDDTREPRRPLRGTAAAS